MEGDYQLEEYRLLNENIRKNSDRNFQLTIFCFTAFSVIISLSEQIEDKYIIPLAMLSVLWICVVSLRNNAFASKRMIVYIMKNYENETNKIKFQHEKMKMEKQEQKYQHDKRKMEDTKRKQKYWIFKIIFILSKNSFFILTLILLACYYIFDGFNEFRDVFLKPCWDNISYMAVSIIGISSIFYYIYVIESRGLKYFMKKFRNE